MSKVEELYDKNLIRLRTCCSVFNDLENKCSAKKCVCQSIAECLAYQDTVLPNGYSKADILNFNGHVNGKRTLDNHSVATSVCKILEFCFGDFKVNDSSTRYDLHKNSKMDTRFSNGTNLIINGKSSSSVKNKLGKTMLASIVMKEAIWRRMFNTNKAYTYMFKSCSEIIDDIISKKNSELQVSSFNADWLCIDDIFLSNKQLQGNILDQVISVRNREKLPSIIITQFDPLKDVDAESSVGNHIMKMFSDQDNTFVLSLS